MSDCGDDADEDTMDSCDGPLIQVGGTNTLNYSPCSVEVDCVTEYPSPESENQRNFIFDDENGDGSLQLETPKSHGVMKHHEQVQHGTEDVMEVPETAGKTDRDGNVKCDVVCNDDIVSIQSLCEPRKDDTDEIMKVKSSATSTDTHSVSSTKDKDDKVSYETPCGRDELNNSHSLNEFETESSDKEPLDPTTRQIYMLGLNNVVNIINNGKTETSFNLEENTVVEIEYNVKVIRVNDKDPSQRTIDTHKSHTKKVRIVAGIKDNEIAESAAFVAMHRGSVREALDNLFSGISHVIDLIEPGSIVIEIKPTSENSIRTLLESVNNGKFDNIVKEILSQESVMKHIKGKKVTVTVELNIPEELLEKEGIAVIDNSGSSQIDIGSDLAVTVKDEDPEDETSSQSSSVDPPDISADVDLSSSVDPIPQSATVLNPNNQISSEMEQSSALLPVLPIMSSSHASSSYTREKPRTFHKLSLSYLEVLAQNDPSEILITLDNNKKDFQDIISRKLTNRGTRITTSVLGKASQCDSMPQLMNELLTRVLPTKFLDESFCDFIGQLEDNDTGLKQAIRSVLPFLRGILERMPTDGWEKVQRIALFINGKWLRNKQTDTEINKDIEDLFELIQLKKQQASQSQQLGEDDDDDEFQTPPETYRKLPIIPLKEELDGSMEIFLLPNKVGKKFRDPEHYLECQFRLFRADVILPLKQNIEDFRAVQKTSTTYRVYSGVQILRPVCSENGLCYRIAFDPKPLHRVKWDTSQRLIFGSLLCLSSDNFVDNMLFATVNNREVASLKKGLVDVQFLSDDLNFTTLSRDLRFDMVESPAYFESYKDILKGMQTLNDRTLPFQEYIVDCQSIVREPIYLQKQRNPQYDLRPLIDHNYKISDVTGEQTFSEESKVALNIPVKDKLSWPNIDDLDSSQLNAMQNALTREFALLHGPPGTGKTYLGIKILKVLLHNPQVWLQGQTKLPILVVCYTNHALDQFLEGILSTFKGKLLRVGGRIKSDLLQPHSLKNARKRVKDMKAVPSHLFEAKMVTSRAMNKLKRDIDRIAAKMEVAQREIIHENCLKEIMSKRLERCFAERESHSARSPYIITWLGVDKKLDELDKDTRVPTDVLEEMELEEDEEDTVETIDLPESRMYQRRLEEDTLDVFFDSDSDDSRDNAGEIRSEKRQSNIAVNVTSLDDYTESPSLFRPFTPADREKMKRKRRLKTYLMKEITSTDIMTENEEKQIKDIWKIWKFRDRWRLYRYWVDLFCRKSKEQIKNKEEEYKRVAVKFKEILMQEDRVILQNCSVIGMTTTGAARYQKILNEIGPKIIVIEEAAEVLEAHVIGTLSRGCQHLILIGDHKQLRPNPTVHELAKKYNLEISLFERMVKSGIHCDMLEWQHRMRPEIANTIRSLYQDRLRDHELVTKYGNVRGIASNVYFIEHQHKHDFDEETKSFLNEHEAGYLVALCKYLLKQGYHKHQITILTFYSAQIQCLRRKMPKSEFNGVRVIAVDSYQGEENDIILLSLVRSKTEGTIGFLKEENRICVALSRAKMGMYVIGNFSHIAEHSDLLKEICLKVNDQGKLGPALPLCCQRHPTDDVVGAIDAADFDEAPEGGCKKPCDYRLPCGHVCPKVCHGNDLDHKDYKCSKPCQKPCKHGHSNCTELCYKPCSPCEEPVRTKLPKCGHIEDVPCHLDPSHYQCKEMCSEILPCGHKCPGLCGAPHPACDEPIELDLPCGHRSSVPCGQRNTYPCNNPCGTILQCGHQCQGTCGGCYQGRLHQPCTSKCKQILICGHECQSTCNLTCPPCEMPCENKCSHSQCNRKCGELCATCKEPCELKCRHETCESLCGSRCTRKRCNDRCKKKLACGHPCKGLCGEICPPVCRVCNKDQIAEIHSIFGTEDKAGAHFIQLDCGDIFEVTSLDKWIAETPEDENKTVVKLKECPRCRQPVRKSLRYANIIKQGLENIEKVKEKMKGNEESVKKLQESLENLTRRFTGQDRLMVQQLTQTDRVPSEIVLSSQINQLRILYQIISMESMIRRSVEGSEESEKRYMTLLSYINDFKEWITMPRHSFSPQEINDSRREIMRLSLLRFCTDVRHLIETEKKDIPGDLMKKLSVLVHRLELPSLFTDSDLHDAKELRGELRVYLPQSQIGVSEEERLMIVEAVGLNRGHWYKCKEGHVYAIGECGRADEEAECPECGGAIGGVSHQLSEDNAWAPEMDDAVELPWSEERDREYALMLDRELNG